MVSLTCFTKTPKDCCPAELDRFYELAIESKEVTATNLKHRIARARWLAFLVAENEIVGIAALKVPEESYREAVAEASGVTLDTLSFPYELGWIYVRPVMQGHHGSRRLVEALLGHVTGLGLYATSTSDKERMHRTLQWAGFERAGQTYRSQRRPKALYVFIRAANARNQPSH